MYYYPTAGRKFRFDQVVHTYPAVLKHAWRTFSYQSEEYINTRCTLFRASCHHVLCSVIVDRPLPYIELDRHLVPTGSFCCCSICWRCQGRVRKKLPTKSQRKAIVELHEHDRKHNAHYFSTFSLISWPKMEIKTCRFGPISDSATRSTSCRRFFEIHFRCGD